MCVHRFRSGFSALPTRFSFAVKLLKGTENIYNYFVGGCFHPPKRNRHWKKNVTWLLILDQKESSIQSKFNLFTPGGNPWGGHNSPPKFLSLTPPKLPLYSKQPVCEIINDIKASFKIFWQLKYYLLSKNYFKNLAKFLKSTRWFN